VREECTFAYWWFLTTILYLGICCKWQFCKSSFFYLVLVWVNSKQTKMCARKKELVMLLVSCEHFYREGTWIWDRDSLQ